MKRLKAKAALNWKTLAFGVIGATGHAMEQSGVHNCNFTTLGKILSAVGIFGIGWAAQDAPEIVAENRMN